MTPQPTRSNKHSVVVAMNTPSQSFSGRTRIGSEQMVNLMTGEAQAPETSLNNNSDNRRHLNNINVNNTYVGSCVISLKGILRSSHSC